MVVFNKVVSYLKSLRFYGVLLAASLLLNACAQEVYHPALDSKGRRYHAGDLAKDWRDNIKQNRNVYMPEYPQYPQDNDEEYYYPKYNKGGGYQPQPQRHYPPLTQQPSHAQQPASTRQPSNVRQPSRPNLNPYAYPVPADPYGSNMPYPQDNDAEYKNPYPKYDPDADNGDYNYPIYFD